MALHWVLGEEDYKQFEANQLRKTREWVEVIWRHIPTEDNPAHRASRDKLVSKENQLWWREPDWLSNPRIWPKSLVTPPRNPTKKRKPHRSCSLWPWIHMTISTNSFPRTHTKKSMQNKRSSLYRINWKEKPLLVVAGPEPGDSKHRRGGIGSHAVDAFQRKLLGNGNGLSVFRELLLQFHTPVYCHLRE